MYRRNTLKVTEIKKDVYYEIELSRRNRLMPLENEDMMPGKGKSRAEGIADIYQVNWSDMYR